MTKNAAAKKAARARVEQTGEKYTAARRSTAHAKAARLDPDRDAGTVTLIVSGFGAANLGLVLDDLAHLIRRGHPLVSTDHRSGRGIADLPSPYDFAVARGIATVTEVAAIIKDDDRGRLEELARRATDGIRYLGPRLVSSEWSTALTPGPRGQAPVLWVQDVQIDSPIAEQPGDDDLRTPDHVPLQLAALRALAQRTQAIIVVGHCIPGEAEQAWRSAADEADRTFVSVPDWDGETRNGNLPHTLREIAHDRTETQRPHPDNESAFFTWRDSLR